jgi:hypothetical protein
MYRAVSLRIMVEEISKHRLDLVEVQEGTGFFSIIRESYQQLRR